MNEHNELAAEFGYSLPDPHLVDQVHQSVEVGQYLLRQEELPTRLHPNFEKTFGGGEAVAKRPFPPAKPIGGLFEAEKADLAGVGTYLLRPLGIARFPGQPPDAQELEATCAVIAELVTQVVQALVVVREVRLPERREDLHLIE